jgi:hypothetical protein
MRAFDCADARRAHRRRHGVFRRQPASGRLPVHSLGIAPGDRLDLPEDFFARQKCVDTKRIDG